MKKTFYVLFLALFAFLMFGCNKETQAKSEKPTAPKSSTVAPTKSASKSTSTSKSVTESKQTTSTEAPHTHTWDEGSVTTPATCTEKGVKTFTCACGETKTEEIEVLGHDLVDDAAIPATCTAPGKEAGKHCSRCEYTEGGAEVEALGHDYTVEVENTAQTATCTAPGKEADHKCSRCDSVETGAEIAALGHNYEKVDAVAATHDAFGVAEHYECSRCHALALDEEGTQATTAEELKVDKLVRVSFNTNGGSEINPIDVVKGTKSSGLSSFTTTKDGYQFEGWYFNSVKLTGEEEVNEDLTVVANWLEIINVSNVLKELCLYQDADQSVALVDGHTTETVVSVTLGESQIDFVQTNGDVALDQTAVKASGRGLHDLVIKTNKSIINAKVEAFDVIASNATELAALFELMNSADGKNGNYLLDADIDASGVTWTNSGRTFGGIFDGRGHIISNLSSTSGAGIVKELTGTFKNVAFINGTGNRCFMVYQNSGIIENIYAQATVPTGYTWYGFVSTNRNDGANSLMKNCVLNITLPNNEGTGGGVAGALYVGQGEFNNCYLINNGSAAGTLYIGTNSTNVDIASFTNVYGYTNTNDFIYNASFNGNGWASYFVVDEEGFYFNDSLLIEYVDEVIEKDFDCYSKSFNSGVIEGNIKSAKIGGADVNVTYNNGVITLTDNLTVGSKTTLIIRTDSKKYVFSLTCYAVIASNPTELAALFEMMNSADGKNLNYLLDADIDATDVTWTNSGRTYGGTFDGRGHIISNLASTNGAGIVKENMGTFKNMAFINGTGNRCFLIYQNSGTIENVYVEATVPTSWTWYGVVSTQRYDGVPVVVKNCVFNITLPKYEDFGGGVAGALYPDNVTLENCYLINNGGAEGTVYLGTNTRDAAYDISKFTNVVGFDSVSSALSDMSFAQANGWNYFSIADNKVSFNGTVVLQ